MGTSPGTGIWEIPARWKFPKLGKFTNLRNFPEIPIREIPRMEKCEAIQEEGNMNFPLNISAVGNALNIEAGAQGIVAGSCCTCGRNV